MKIESKKLNKKLKKSGAKKAASLSKKNFVGKIVFKNKLTQAFAEESNVTLTQNGARTYKSSLSATVDFFAMGAALRSRSEDDIVSLFQKAFNEDPLVAAKVLFYIRNARGGQGERRTFRTVLRWLGNNQEGIVRKNLANIVKFGRFDDLFYLIGTKSEEVMFSFLQAQLEEDIKNYDKGNSISLLAKWMKSINTSCQESRNIGYKTASFLGLTPRNYRKLLSALRERINVTERLMCANKWKEINYAAVPSKAHLNYKKAFGKHDPEGYLNYLHDVKTGEKKINATTLYPYEIYESFLKSGSNDTLDALWNALPNYLEGNKRNILTVCDVSGSMSGRPMAVSISLGVYTAQRNEGAFKDYFITFSTDPLLQKISGSTVKELFNSVNTNNAGCSTDLVKVFSNLLDFSIKNKVPKADMPEQVVVVTDVEFNNPQNGKTNFETIKDLYKKSGYTFPNLVFWNVNSTQNNVPAKANQKGVILVSGCSPSIFKSLLSGKTVTPEDQMLETISAKVYDSVVI